MFEKQNERPYLIISKEEAEKQIEEQIQKGCEFYKREVLSKGELEQVLNDVERWIRYTYELLESFFNNTDPAKEFKNAGDALLISIKKSILTEDIEDLFKGFIKDFKLDLNHYLENLRSLQERLKFYERPTIETKEDTTAQHKLPSKINTNKVFIVHGHDNEAKETVARFIEKIGLEAIILHEQASAGRTIIEKIEAHSEVDFAIVLLTPDDVGAAKDKKDNLQPRARQNVILELGYFMAKLGRGKVAALHKGNTDIPSDYQGVLYTPLDTSGAWKYFLAKEMQAAGINVDMNKI
ncbi:nucleotide-binding protein [Bacillus sp. FJAT-52991]|uniref:Nucleotide-binding protein n=1 Tax=Bacillus kandeliae TaxID=3129297 RepID=A0ABZ2NCI5_9BACI